MTSACIACGPGSYSDTAGYLMHWHSRVRGRPGVGGGVVRQLVGWSWGTLNFVLHIGMSARDQVISPRVDNLWFWTKQCLRLIGIVLSCILALACSNFKVLKSVVNLI